MSNSCDCPPPISLDIGSGTTKGGFSGDESPLFEIPTICGRPIRSTDQQLFTRDAKPDNPDDRSCGDDAIIQKSYLNLQYFVENGVVCNWDNWEHALHQVFYRKLQVEPENHPLIVNTVPLNPKADKEKMTQICFETFNLPAVYFSNPAQMSLFSSGRTFGVSLLCGDGVTLAAPFLDDGLYLENKDVVRMNFGGRDLNDYLLKLVMGRGKCSLPPLLGREVMREVKESGFFTCNPSSSSGGNNLIQPSRSKKYYFKLPDGSRIELKEELEECTEPLFRTDLVSSSLQFSGIHEMVHHSISNLPIEYRKQLYKNIVLDGGSTLFNGFQTRLENELSSLTQLPLNIHAHENRKHTVWFGQSIFSSLSSFESLWLTKEQYDESGPCFIRSRRLFW